MGFIKVGDEQHIDGFVDTEGDVVLCPKCNNPMAEIKIQNGSVKLVCSHCEDK